MALIRSVIHLLWMGITVVPYALAIMLGNFAKKSTAKWLEGSKIFLFVAFPIGFTVLQAQPGVMGFVVTDREYVRFPPESQETKDDVARIKRTAKIIREIADEEAAKEKVAAAGK